MPKQWKTQMREAASTPGVDEAHPVDIRDTVLAAAEVNPDTVELDLHGMSVADARRVLDDFLDAALHKQERTGRIIFGIGMGALQHTVTEWLQKKTADNTILATRFSDRTASVTFLLLE